jgi:ATP-dependent helicase/nuclease subunit B
MLREAEKSRFIDGDSPLGATDWWLAQRFITRRVDYVEALRREYRWLGRGHEAVTARESDALTRWDGVLSIDAAAIDPRLTGRVMSASQVEKMAACPFGWFLRYILRVTPREDLVRDPEKWLDPRNLGSVLHAIFEKTMQQLCGLGVRPNLTEHMPLMTIVADATLAEWRARVPPPNDAAFSRQRDEVLRTCATFLRLEEEACRDSEAMFFELPFGFADAESHPAGMVEPLVIGLGGGRSVKFRGRIDRVDRATDGTWRVWDYKTGSTYGWGGVWTFARGRKVQHAIYARALAAALRSRGIDDAPVIQSSGYSFPTPKGGGERIAVPTTGGELESVLNQTFDVIASGFFPHPATADECRFCEFSDVCGGAAPAAERAVRKHAADEASSLVQYWRRLQAVR